MSEKNNKTPDITRSLTDNERTQVAIMNQLKVDVGDAIVNFRQLEKKEPVEIHANGALYEHMKAYGGRELTSIKFLGLSLIYKDGLSGEFEIF